MIIDAKGQIAIPTGVCIALGIGPGSQVEFAMNDAGQIVFRKAGEADPPPHPFDRLVGIAASGMSTEELMAMTRGGHWETPGDADI